MHGRTHAARRDKDVHVRPGQRRVRNHEAITIAMANQAAASKVGTLSGARAWWLQAQPTRIRRRRGLASLAHQGIMILLQVNDSAAAHKLFEHLFQWASLAGAEPQLNDKLPQSKRLVRMLLKDL